MDFIRFREIKVDVGVALGDRQASIKGCWDAPPHLCQNDGYARKVAGQFIDPNRFVNINQAALPARAACRQHDRQLLGT